MKKGTKLDTAFNVYTVLGQIGQGGAGRVFSVSDTSGQTMALKLVHASSGPEKLKRFANEISFCRKCSHRNVIKVLDEGFVNEGGQKHPFYVMPLFDSNLRALISEGILSQRVLPVFGQILDGVEAAHLTKSWHRDLKPENILANKSHDHLIVADFGIAHFSEEFLVEAIETQHKDRLANFQYAAPEQKQRGQMVSQSADIYALGLILNELFTKEIPLGKGHRTIASVAPDLAYLDAIVDKMLSQSPEARFQSIDELKRELIGQGNQFIALQKLSSLENAVVPTSENDDPLIKEPVRLVAHDFRDETLFLTLNHHTNSIWAEGFFNPSTYNLNRQPRSASVNGNQVSVRSRPDDAVAWVNDIKGWLDIANHRYKAVVEERCKVDLERQRQEMSNNVRKERERLEVLKRIKI